MQPSSLQLRPETVLPPELPFEYLLKFPELQKRINSGQFEISGIHSMISSIEQDAIDALKQEFVLSNNQVNMQQFVWLIGNSLSLEGKNSRDLYFCEKSLEQAYRSYEFEYELVKVFEEIDIDHSNSISWEEYIEYISASSLLDVETKKSTGETNKEVVYSHHEKTLYRKNPLRKIVEIEKKGLLGIVQRKSGNLRFINLDGTIPKKKFELSQVDYDRVLSFDYSEEDRIFGILMNNRRVTFVEDGEMQKNHGEHKYSGDEIDIVYLRVHKMWLLLCLDESVHIFKAPKGRGQLSADSNKILLSFIPHGLSHSNPIPHKGVKKDRVFGGNQFRSRKHGISIIGIKQLHNPMALCTASIHGQVRIWSLWDNQLLVQLEPCRENDSSSSQFLKGFQVFNQDSASYIICWMFSTQISVWLPSSSLSKSYLGKLKGHTGIIEAAKFLTHYSMVLSIDNKNCAKLWNIKGLSCLQAWKLEGETLYQIHMLSCIPYAVFYHKIMTYYKVKCEESLFTIHQKMGRVAAIESIDQKNSPRTDERENPKIKNIHSSETSNNAHRTNDSSNINNIQSKSDIQSTLHINSKSAIFKTQKDSRPDSSTLNGNYQDLDHKKQWEEIAIGRSISLANVESSPLHQFRTRSTIYGPSNKNVNLPTEDRGINHQNKSAYKGINETAWKIGNESIDSVHQTIPAQPPPMELVKQIIYDDYYDSLLILSEQQIKIVSINNGNIVHEIKPTLQNECFVAMCLRKHRRLFVANSLGDLLYFRVEDCVKLYTWKLYDSMPNSRFQVNNNPIGKKRVNKLQNTKLSIQNPNNEMGYFEGYEIFALDYNTHNDTLIVIAQSQHASMITTIDSQLIKSKQIGFDQYNLVSFASSANYNLFYVASNDPALVTIWDYHSIMMIKTLQMPHAINSISAQNCNYNILFIVESAGIHVLRINGLEPKKNNKLKDFDSGNLIKWHRYLDAKGNSLIACEFVKCSSGTATKNRKIKTHFAIEHDKSDDEGSFRATKMQQLTQNCGIYIQTGSKLVLANLNGVLSDMQQQSSILEPSKSCKANITKQFKFVQCQPLDFRDQIPKAPEGISCLDNYLVQSISNLKQKLCKIGCVRGFIYFVTMTDDHCNSGTGKPQDKVDQESSGVLNFYDYNESKVIAKLSLPQGEIIAWEICLYLGDKIFERLKLSEKISEEIHGRHGKSNFTVTLANYADMSQITAALNLGSDSRLNYLRKAFILNKYLRQEDIPALEKYIKKRFQSKRKLNSSSNNQKNPAIYINYQGDELFTGQKLMLSQILLEHQHKQQTKKQANDLKSQKQSSSQQQLWNNESLFQKPTRQLEKSIVKPRTSGFDKTKFNSQSKSEFATKDERNSAVPSQKVHSKQYSMKLKEISEKYSQAFQYIDHKRLRLSQHKEDTGVSSGTRLQIPKSAIKKPRRSQSCISLKKKAASATKILNSQMKNINEYLNKIDTTSDGRPSKQRIRYSRSSNKKLKL